jgi:glycosyltransferase involved in cell wall biosynthesis
VTDHAANASSPRVAIVHLGRAAAMGGMRRVAEMRSVFEAAGAEVHDVPLLTIAPVTPRSILGFDPLAVAAGRAVPETMAWSPRQARHALDEIGPHLVVCSTARSFHPSFAARWPVLLDYIDRLSVSYRDRVSVHRGPVGWGFRVLAARNARFERDAGGAPVRRLAAGWADAAALDATWVPISMDPGPDLGERPEISRTVDAVFVGNLSYPPNVEAIERLSVIWPAVARQRPGSQLVLAGARPTEGVRRLAVRHGWGLRADFDDLVEVLASTRLAVAPLTHASGIQTKVLEAAAHGVAQVVSPAAAAGLDPEFPLDVASTDEEFAARIIELLDDHDARRAAGAAARDHIADRYATRCWVPWAGTELDRVVG